MLTPMKVPQGGFNQEFRQHPNFPGGYIYSHTGDNYDAYMSDIYPLLPDRVSFSTHELPSDLQKDQPGTNGIPQTAVLYPYPGTPPAGMPWRITLRAGHATVDCLLIARILTMQPVSGDDGTSDASVTWSKGLIERHTETTLLAGNTLYELVGEDGDRYALVATFPTDDGSSDAIDLPPPPPGYQYETSPLEEDFVLTCHQLAHILVTSGYNFQRYERGSRPD
ncbi:hypothetical protein [Nitrospirillum sp. BR 11828]|uniref:hypothetical protein n=1 Tax=Nitrospirillum sp. BR 11828 TaxID=3104325 RepID=UPI002ACA6385|nr:hypothetical protein [Nitrospirillum sp. BR 11828]MDZ5649139.1 hypothetical protein [Nitrospirillum sp. BR 11828]